MRLEERPARKTNSEIVFGPLSAPGPELTWCPLKASTRSPMPIAPETRATLPRKMAASDRRLPCGIFHSRLPKKMRPRQSEAFKSGQPATVDSQAGYQWHSVRQALIEQLSPTGFQQTPAARGGGRRRPQGDGQTAPRGLAAEAGPPQPRRLPTLRQLCWPRLATVQR